MLWFCLLLLLILTLSRVRRYSKSLHDSIQYPYWKTTNTFTNYNITFAFSNERNNTHTARIVLGCLINEKIQTKHEIENIQIWRVTIAINNTILCSLINTNRNLYGSLKLIPWSRSGVPTARSDRFGPPNHKFWSHTAFVIINRPCRVVVLDFVNDGATRIHNGRYHTR